MLLSLINLDKFNLKLIIFIFFLKLFSFIKFCLLLIIIIIFYFTKFSLQIKPNKKLHYMQKQFWRANCVKRAKTCNKFHQDLKILDQNTK